MKKICILLLSLCLALSFTSCSLFELSSPGTNPPSSNGGNSDTCKHTKLETIEGYDATCTETGLTDGKKCVLCDEIIQVQNIIEIKQHIFDDTNDKICNSCGYVNSDAPTFVVSEARSATGDENITVTLSLKNNPGISSIILDITYDDAELELTKIEYNTEIGGQTIYPQELQSPVTLYWINGFADTTGDWIFATLYFDISQDAIGEYDIHITYDKDNVYNISEENIAFDTVVGKIIVE